MLTDRLVNLPGAAHSLWKHNKISRPKADGLAPIRGHRHIPVQQQTGFTLVVGPGKCADVAAPNWPITQAKRQDRALGTRRCDADHRFTSADFLRLADFEAPDHPQQAIHAANVMFVGAKDR